MPRGRRLAVATAAALTVVALVGCSGSQPDAAEPTAEAMPTPKPATGDAGAAETVTVRAVDYDFEGLPDRVQAGTKLELVNESTAELHELVAIRLPDDETRPVAELVQLPEEETADFPEPAAVLLAPPAGGEQIAAVGDGTLAEPGRYAVVCFIPVGADPDAILKAAAQGPPEGGDAPEGQDGPPSLPGAGPPHVTEGMFAELTVE